MMGLTDKQAMALNAIKALTVGHRSPSYAEIQHSLGLSSKGEVYRLVCALEERGAIRRRPRRARALEVIDGGRDQAIASLRRLDAKALREVLAHTVGLLAEQEGVAGVAAMLHRLGDRLPRRLAS